MLFKCGSPLTGGREGRAPLLVRSHFCRGVMPRAGEGRGEERGGGTVKEREGEVEGGREEGLRARE